MKPFSLIESYNEGRYSIIFEHSLLNNGTICGGSFNVIGARVLGLSFANYLRYMRDRHNATLKGREGYSSFYFNNQADGLIAIQELNKAWKKIEDVLPATVSPQNERQKNFKQVNEKIREIRLI